MRFPGKKEMRLGRAEQRERVLLGQCWACGGSEFMEATDTEGCRYIGCARCIIVLGKPKARLREAVRP